MAVGAAIESAIYALGSVCILILRRRDTRERPFRLVAARPLATFGAVLFTILFLATGLSDPEHPSRLSVVPLAVILVIGALSFGYVRLEVPRLQATAAARAAASRPRRRPQRTASGEAGTDPGVSGRLRAVPDDLPAPATPAAPET